MSFTSADTHWNTANMLYGDSGGAIPSTEAIKQSGNLYGYCLADPLRYVDRLGKSGSDVHIGTLGDPNDPLSEPFGTVYWADKVGISPEVAQVIAYANKEIDFPVNDLSLWGTPAIPISYPSIGSNLSTLFSSNSDSDKPLLLGLTTNAVVHASYIQTPIGPVLSIAPASQGQAFHFNMQHDPEIVAALGLNSDLDTRLNLAHLLYHGAIKTQNPQYLGWGLHALQDFFAHGNKGVPGIDPNYGFRDRWTSRLFGMSGHTSGTGNNLDSIHYAWDDCRLISANNNVGAANNPTTISAGLASMGFMASWNFEVGN